MRFHWQELVELIKSHQLIPYFAFNSFSFSGSAILTMYPYLFLYPFAILFRLTQSIQFSIYIGLSLYLFFALLISYFSSYSFSKDRRTSLMFTLMYCFSDIFIINNFITSDLGFLFALIMAPLVIFGFIAWLKQDNWLMLSIGMTGVVFSSVLATIILGFLLLVWTLINCYRFSFHKIINLIKAAIVTTITSSIFWIPALKLFIYNKLKMPRAKIQNGDNPQSLHNIFSLALHVHRSVQLTTYDHFVLTLYSILGLLCGFIFFFKLRSILKQSYLLSVLIILLSSTLFPWNAAAKIFPIIQIIQFTGRLYILPQVLLTYICANIIFGKNKLRIKLPKTSLGFLLIIIGLIFGLYSSVLQSAFNQKQSKNLINNDIISSRYANPNYVESQKMLDYYPQQAVPEFKNITKGLATYSPYHHDALKVIPKGSGNYIINNSTPRAIQNCQLPILYYQNNNYKGYLNHHLIPITSSHQQLLVLKHLPKGQHLIRIQVQNNYKIYLVLMMLGLLTYISCGLLRSKKRYS